MSEPIISVENLSKRYWIGHRSAERERYAALRDVIVREGRNFARKAIDLVRGKQVVQGDEVEEFWALRNVSFDVEEGDILGIIGRNGAGKSTLLKILSRITEPTEGRITLRGHVSSLLEVGTGFHPELSGRENIYLNGAILGMTQREIRKKFDEIVAFAEVERFLDTPMKRYSSGMYMRLAFSVAAHLEPEVLIVDEVLAVGDSEFQNKCLGKMGDIAQGGRTVLFVSHNLDAVRNLCKTGVLLKAGNIEFKGDVAECVERYRREISQGERSHYRRADKAPAQEWYVEEAWLEQRGFETNKIDPTQSLIIAMQIRGSSQQRMAVEFVLRDQNNYPILFCPSSLGFGHDLSVTGGLYAVKIFVDLPPLAIGHYHLDLNLALSGISSFDSVESALSFDVETAVEPGWLFRQTTGQGSITVPRGSLSIEYNKVTSLR
ncbi:MAG: polysaccharide ABC transporter ATP-binding protein [Stellaceae bacterium]